MQLIRRQAKHRLLPIIITQLLLRKMILTKVSYLLNKQLMQKMLKMLKHLLQPQLLMLTSLMKSQLLMRLLLLAELLNHKQMLRFLIM